MTVKVLLAVLVLLVACTGFANAAPRSTAEVDQARLAEFQSIFGGVVAGYTAHDHQVRMEGDHGHMAKDAHMAEGAKCHAGHDGGCCEECCPCRDGWYDCWGVWQTDDMYDFAAVRESDYDPVMGRGEYGDSFFGWGGW
jgi:hypothetical protein